MSKLAPQLTGKAQQAYTALNATDATDYDKVKEAILARYDINCETYRRRFRTATKQPGETHRELATRIRDLVCTWTRDCKTVDEIREVVAVEQLLDSLPHDVSIWVRERKPDKVYSAGQLAEDYLQARGLRDQTEHTSGMDSLASRPTRRQNESEQPGHLAKDYRGRDKVR